jgi:hypothetical protein
MITVASLVRALPWFQRTSVNPSGFRQLIYSEAYWFFDGRQISSPSSAKSSQGKVVQQLLMESGEPFYHKPGGLTSR